MKRTITVTVNGSSHSAEVEPRLLLVHFLRDQLGLTGIAHRLRDVALRRLHRIARRSSREILQPLRRASRRISASPPSKGSRQMANCIRCQEAFWNEHGLQCGFCTPGMVMACKELLEHTPVPTDEEIRHAIDGNLCRCTGYQHIVNAVKSRGGRLRCLERESIEATYGNHHCPCTDRETRRQRRFAAVKIRGC